MIRAALPFINLLSACPATHIHLPCFPSFHIHILCFTHILLPSPCLHSLLQICVFRARMRGASMASSALSRIIPDLPHHQLPRHSLFPFPPSLQDPLPCTSYPQSFLLSPSPSLSNSPFVRKIFEDAVCSHPVLDQELESADNSTDSSVSSCFVSSNSDDEEDDSGSSSSSSLSHLERPPQGPLDNLTSLCAALPIKRGLSRYFTGKSQSFSSLARVSSLADLAKPENPHVKRRRTGCTGADKNHSYPPRCGSSAGISKRSTTSNRYKSLKSMPRPEDALLDGHARPKPSKCFSVPEF